MQIKILAEGGEMKPGPALSQKLGPAGIPLNKVIQEINEATKGFKGMKVPVELDINLSTKEFDIKVFSPPVSELLKKEMGIEKGSPIQKKNSVANASIEQIISVAKTKFPDLLSRNLEAAVKTVLGSCISLGILVESKNPHEVILEIEQGKYNSEISQEKTKTSEEKRKELDDSFEKIKAEQEKILKLEEEAAKAAEAEKAAAAGEKPAEGEEEKKEEAPEAEKEEGSQE
jgi:large subunit ribosomal protein L11